MPSQAASLVASQKALCRHLYLEPFPNTPQHHAAAQVGAAASHWQRPFCPWTGLCPRACRARVHGPSGLGSHVDGVGSASQLEVPCCAGEARQGIAIFLVAGACLVDRPRAQGCWVWAHPRVARPAASPCLPPSSSLCPHQGRPLCPLTGPWLHHQHGSDVEPLNPHLPGGWMAALAQTAPR